MRASAEGGPGAASPARRRATGRTLFDSALGPCGLAWHERALTRVLLPGATRDETAELLARVSGNAPEVPAPWGPPAPHFVADAVAAMQSLLRGEPAELRALPIDLGVAGPFERAVYEATRRLGPGQTSTYGELAQAIGQPDAARAVGVALGRNPWPLVVPCHRVLAAGGRLGGFSAPGGSETKRRLLALEAALAPRAGELF